MNGVQLGMSIDPAVIPDVGPRKQTRVGSEIPFLFLL